MALSGKGPGASGTGRDLSAGRWAGGSGQVAAPGALADLCTKCKVRCLPLFRPFDPDDLCFVQWMLTVQRSSVADSDVLCTDEHGSGPYTLWDGWAYLYREVPEIGTTSRQQIL